jgi:hypothetical protein
VAKSRLGRHRGRPLTAGGIVSGVSGDLRGMTAYHWFRNDLDLTWADEHAMVRFAGEILDTLNCSVVLASGFVQFDSDRERGGAVETNETSARGNFDDAPYHWLGHRRPVVMERSKPFSIVDRTRRRTSRASSFAGGVEHHAYDTDATRGISGTQTIV